MQELAELLRRWQAEVIFPARVRVFAAVGGVELAPLCDDGVEWEGAPAGMVLAAACGAAWAERERGGRVVVVLPAEAMADGEVRAALDLCVACDLRHLLLVVSGWPMPRERDLLQSSLFHCDDEPPSGLPASLPTAWMIDSERERTAWMIDSERERTRSPPRARRAWPPVRLRTLLAPPPATSAAAPFATARAWLRDVAAREARLVLIDPDLAALPAVNAQVVPPRPNAAALIALAALAGEGRRVVWELPADVDLLAWLPALAEIGRRGLALKLVLPTAALPSATLWSLLPGWWVFAPADAAETVAVLAHALDSEEAVIIAVPDAPAEPLPTWTGAYEPGSGRWLRGAGSAAITVVCDQRTVAATMAACAALTVLGIKPDVLHATSLAPLPLAAIAAAAGRGAVLVVDHPASQLGRAVRAELDDGARVQVLDGVASPVAADIAQAVRTLTR